MSNRDKAQTYVMQVESGREARAQGLVESLADPDVVREVFCPSWEKHITLGGGRARVERMLLTPGYLYVVTPDADEAARQLRGVPAFTRLLGSEAGFVPLTDKELVWVN